MAFGEKLRDAIDRIKNSMHVDKDLIKEVIKEIQRALITSDVNIQLVLKISQEIEKEAFEEIPDGVTRKEHLVKTCYNVILKYIGGDEEKKLNENPERMLLCGLFGSGKTTTASKLAKFYKKRGLKVGLICADVYRPAAYEQLEQLSKQVDVLFYGDPKEMSAKKVTEKGMEFLKKQGANLIIVDSAGRSALDNELVQELKEIYSVFNPEYSFLVISADIGQAAKDQSENFNKAVGIQGVIITKLDGSAKGGGAITACYITKSPIFFIGTGEKADDFEIFDANRYLSRILGFGDIQSLLEKIHELSEDEDFEGMKDLNPEDILKGNFNFALFKQQIDAARKLGPFTKIMGMLGIGGKLSADQMNIGEKKIKKYRVILDSFTKEELNCDETSFITSSRIKRIAKGSGTTQEDVKELIAHVKKMKKMFKAVGGKKAMTMQKMLGKSGMDFSKLEGMDPKQIQEMAKQMKIR